MGKEKKEIGKLLELLNEYDEGGNWRKLHWKGLGCEDHDTIGYKDKELTCEQDEIVAYLISKKFGFIQRLVEKNKINISKSGINELPAMYAYDYDSIECKTDRLLMLLAIQDNPIDFLLSILK